MLHRQVGSIKMRPAVSYVLVPQRRAREEAMTDLHDMTCMLRYRAPELNYDSHVYQHER